MRNTDSPAFIRDCQTVAQQGAAGYMVPGRLTEYHLMVPSPSGGVRSFASMPIGDPAAAMARIERARRRDDGTPQWAASTSAAGVAA